MASRWDTSAVEARLRAFEAECRKAALKGCEDAADELLTRASELCPIEEGTLVRSGRVVTGETGAAVGFGTGGSSDYAIPQHERLDYRHDNGRQAKYLEQPHRAMAPEILQIIGRAVSRVVR
jgi:hypothetical protein